MSQNKNYQLRFTPEQVEKGEALAGVERWFHARWNKTIDKGSIEFQEGNDDGR